MARLVRELDLGVVADGFGEDAFIAALRRLDPERVRAGKNAAHAHARALSDETDHAVMSDIVERLLHRTSTHDG
jgi:hypothetical protein